MLMKRTSFRNSPHFRLVGARPIRHLCLVLGLITLAACSPRTSYWSPVESPKKNKVSWAEFHHPVRFAAASATLDNSEKDALDRFLGRVGRGDGVKVMLATGSAEQTGLTKRRETSLARHLIERGYSVARIQADRSFVMRPDSVRVTVGRFVVKTPTCPDWSKDPTFDHANRQSSNFGCADETNLGLMIANPEALVRGTDIGPADAEVLSSSVGKYRKDQVEKPKSVSSGGG